MRTTSSVIASLLALATCPGSFAMAAAIKVKAAEPVVEELMHGCFLRCAFPWTVSTQLPGVKAAAAVTTLNDESPTTAWVAKDKAFAPGVRFRCKFPQKLPQGMESEVPLYGLNLINGRWQDEDTWKQYGRIKKARLWYKGESMGEVNIPDTRRWVKLTFEDVFIKSGDYLELEVLDVYPGTQQGLAVTEIVLEGGH